MSNEHLANVMTLLGLKPTRANYCKKPQQADSKTIRHICRQVAQSWNEQKTVTKFFSVHHGAFPLVSVWVQHEEPGNLHPCNFEA